MIQEKKVLYRRELVNLKEDSEEVKKFTNLCMHAIAGVDPDEKNRNENTKEVKEESRPPL